MDSGLIGGVIGGILSVIICGYVSSKVSHKSNDCQLKFGTIISSLFWLCLVIVCISFYALFFTNVDIENGFLPIMGLVTGFSIGAIYSFGEAYKVRGKFDSESIEFHTPWSGSKHEKWSDLVSVKFNATANWYTFTFNSGAKVRLSALLTGHGLVVDHVKSLGYRVK